MPNQDFFVLVKAVIWTAAAGQVVLLCLQLRAYSRFRHMSFLILAVGTLLGLILSSASIAAELKPAAFQTLESFYLAAMIGAIAQIPIAIWGVVWLFKSYGELHLKSQAVLPNKSLERTREG